MLRSRVSLSTVVIGGGAAGIAAARTLNDAGADVLLVEASDRLGGRARSITLDLSFFPPRRRPGSSHDGLAEVALSPAIDGVAGPRRRATPAFGSPGKGGVVVDLGCGWLHSAQRNPWTALAEAAGFTVDRSPANWDSQWRDLGFPPEEQEAYGAAWGRWEGAAIAAANGPDRPLSDFLDTNDPWRPLIDAVSGFVNGAPLARVSLHDWAAYEEAATEDDWTVREGYGTLIASHAAGVPMRLGTAVTRVDRRGRRLRLETAAGAIEADRVVVAVPTPALAEEALAFDPPLPDKQAAAADLPLGLADKVFLAVDAPEWPANQHLIGNPHSTCTASHRLSPYGRPVVESFFGGDCAERLEGDDAAAFAIDELVGLLGSGWRARLRPVAVTRWRREPWIGGSYSHARIGRASTRAVLAGPVEERIFFAGEACSARDFSTAHGAYATGVAAARAILAAAR